MKTFCCLNLNLLGVLLLAGVSQGVSDENEDVITIVHIIGQEKVPWKDVEQLCKEENLKQNQNLLNGKFIEIADLTQEKLEAHYWTSPNEQAEQTNGVLCNYHTATSELSISGTPLSESCDIYNYYACEIQNLPPPPKIIFDE